VENESNKLDEIVKSIASDRAEIDQNTPAKENG